MKFRCAALEFSSIQGVLNPMDRPGCSARTPIVLGFEGLDMALWWR